MGVTGNIRKGMSHFSDILIFSFNKSAFCKFSCTPGSSECDSYTNEIVKMYE